MPRRSSNAPDPNVTAFNIVRHATGGDPLTGTDAFAALIREIAGLLADGETPEDLAERFWPRIQEITESTAAAEMGRKGGKKGGKARAKTLSPERRSEIAKKAAAARWNKPKS